MKPSGHHPHQTDGLQIFNSRDMRGFYVKLLAFSRPSSVSKYCTYECYFLIWVIRTHIRLLNMTDEIHVSKLLQTSISLKITYCVV
jgi:hypothetical protein